MGSDGLSWREWLSSFASLFTSTGTLICCALPALFVALGAGGALAALTNAVPQLIWLSQHKLAIFAIAGLLLIFGGWMQWNARYLPCPADPAKAAACARLRRINLGVYGFALLVYGVGAFFAFGAKYLIA